ncbi:hypothetical protein [Paenibacillus thiaminolyticus]|nr:hypothetical protein [Paenibacillus thiaminolyticus]
MRSSPDRIRFRAASRRFRMPIFVGAAPSILRAARASSLHLEGSPQAIDDLCAHWLLGHALVERGAGYAYCKVDELTVYTQTTYLLLSYGSRCGLWSPPG